MSEIFVETNEGINILQGKKKERKENKSTLYSGLVSLDDVVEYYLNHRNQLPSPLQPISNPTLKRNICSYLNELNLGENYTLTQEVEFLEAIINLYGLRIDDIKWQTRKDNAQNVRFFLKPMDKFPSFVRRLTEDVSPKEIFPDDVWDSVYSVHKESLLKHIIFFATNPITKETFSFLLLKGFFPDVKWDKLRGEDHKKTLMDILEVKSTQIIEAFRQIEGISSSTILEYLQYAMEDLEKCY